MLKKIYYWLHDRLSKPEERGEVSAGRWQSAVRTGGSALLDGAVAGTILEVGCGEGLLLKELAKAHPAASLFGVDIRADQLSRARDRMGPADIARVRLLEADATKLPFEDGYFDAVVCINVLLNLPSEAIADKVLCEIARVSKKGAGFIFDIRNKANPIVRLKYRLVKYYDETVDSDHLRTYSVCEIRKKLDALGFSIEKTVSIGFPKGSFAPIIMIRAKKI
jgi:ubiquinone/menaquinone biosynthesis C-methylase UbiE